MSSLWNRVQLQRCVTFLRNKAAPGGAKTTTRSIVGHGVEPKINIEMGRFHYDRAKDVCMFYAGLWALPFVAAAIYLKVFVGPATLTPIPEGQVPHHTEYYKHPGQRLMAKYTMSEQELYERAMHYVWEKDKMSQQALLREEVHRQMKKYGDYAGYYHKPLTARHYRVHRKELDRAVEQSGNFPD